MSTLVDLVLDSELFEPKKINVIDYIKKTKQRSKLRYLFKKVINAFCLRHNSY